MRNTDIPIRVRLRLYASSIAAFLLTLSAACLYISTEDAAWQREKLHTTSEMAVIQASSIEHRILLALSAARILGHEVKIHHGELGDFISQANNLIAALGNITNLQLAPDGVIQHIYPLPGHEKVLGQDILGSDLRRIAANTAIDTKQLVVDGPFKLFQGGRGVIGRYAVFLEDTDGKDKFWGFSSVLITLDDLISATDLPTLVEQGYRYELSHLNPDTGNQEVFLRSGTPLQGKGASFDINLPNKVWTLTLTAVSPEAHGPQYLWHISLALLASSLVAFMVYFLLEQPVRLKSLVAKRTQELEKSSADLKGERFFLSTLLDSISDLVFYKDTEGGYLGCNRAMEAALGISSSNLIGLKGVDVLSGNPACLGSENEAVTPLEEQREEGWLTLKSGSMAYLETIKTPFLGPDGVVAGLIGVCRDVTAHKHAEEALLTTQKRLEFLLSVTSVVIYTCRHLGDNGTSFISENVRFQLGYLPQAFTEESEFWISRVHPEDKAKVLSERQAVFDNDLHLVEYRLLHSDGNYRWLRDELRLVRENTGSPLEVVGCLIDVTASKNIEANLRQDEEP